MADTGQETETNSDKMRAEGLRAWFGKSEALKGITLPLVVRLEGTNVEKARKMLADSGKKIIAASDLTDAAKKVVATLGA